MKHRFRYIVHDVIPDGVVDLADDDAHHLTRVVRRAVGDAVEILDEQGNVWDAIVEDTAPAVRVRVASAPRPAPRRPDVELAIGLADWGRLDLVVEKITEIGVRRMTVFRSERAGRVPDTAAFARRRERMSRVAEAAMRQSGHAAGPGIEGIADLDDVLAGWGEGAILVDPRGTETAMNATQHLAIKPKSDLVLLSGIANLLVQQNSGSTGSSSNAARRGSRSLSRLCDSSHRSGLIPPGRPARSTSPIFSSCRTCSPQRIRHRRRI